MNGFARSEGMNGVAIKLGTELMMFLMIGMNVTGAKSKK